MSLNVRLGIMATVCCLLTSCIVGGQVFFSNESAELYRDCYNQSMNWTYQFEMELRTDCYSAVVDNGECDKGTYSHFGCEQLLENIYACTDGDKLRRAYREECMLQ